MLGMKTCFVSNLKLFKKMLLQALNMHLKQFNTYSTIKNHTFLFTCYFFLKDPLYVGKINIQIVGLRLILGVFVLSRKMMLLSLMVNLVIYLELLTVSEFVTAGGALEKFHFTSGA